MVKFSSARDLKTTDPQTGVIDQTRVLKGRI